MARTWSTLASPPRMSEMHAAVGLLSLQRLDELVKARRVLIERYTSRLGQLPGWRPLTLPARGGEVVELERLKARQGPRWSDAEAAENRAR